MLICVSHVAKSQTRPDVYFFDRLTPGFTEEAVNVPLIFYPSFSMYYYTYNLSNIT
jgi:hypothetical protein